MNSICLSVAPNLRCQGLTRIENIVLLIPPGIELIFSLTLALTSAADSGRTHWLLVLDGLSFFLLALLDFLAHILTQASSTLLVFKIIDFVLAGTSFVPLFLYTLFLFFYARSNLVSLLPTRFRRVVCFALYAIIPPMLAFNELASFLGLKHSSVISDNRTIVAVGFSDTTLQRISLFFGAGTLALLTLFQAALFFLSFGRLVRAFLDERRVEAARDGPDAPDEVHLFRGLGWLALGLKLGAIESIVGFADVSFGVALTRRVLRLLGRGTVIIAIIKGMNVVEDFVRFDSDVRARRTNTTRRSKRFSRFLISNPRFSTFREMSPQASSFHAAQREKKAPGPSPLVLGANSTLNAFQGGGRRRERVTVVYDGKTPPVLQMRFSGADIDMPLPPLPAPVVSLPIIREESLRTVAPWEGTSPPEGNNSNNTNNNDASRVRSTMRSSVSHYSGRADDSLDVVREITAHFPGLPPRVHPGTGREPEPTISPVNSIKRKPAPLASPFPSSESKREREYAARASFASLESESDASSSSSMRTVRTETTPALTRVSTFETAPPGRLASRVMAIEAQGREEDQRRRLERLRRELRAPQVDDDGEAEVDKSRWSDEPVEIPWLQRDPLTELQSAYPLAPTDIMGDEDEGDDTSEAVLDEAWRRAGLTRIKTVSQVRVHTTPRAEEHGTPVRASLFAVEEEDLEMGMGTSVESGQGGILRQASAGSKQARLDSEVLGEEERRMVREGVYT